MPELLSVVLFRLVLVDVDLISPQVVQDLDPGLLLAEVEPPFVDCEADRELYGVSHLALQAIHDELLAHFHPVLLSTALYNRKHLDLLEFIRLRRAYKTHPTRQQYNRHAPRRPHAEAGSGCEQQVAAWLRILLAGVAEGAKILYLLRYAFSKDQSIGPRLQGQETRKGKHCASATLLRRASFPRRCGAGWDRGPRHLRCRGGLQAALRRQPGPRASCWSRRRRRARAAGLQVARATPQVRLRGDDRDAGGRARRRLLGQRGAELDRGRSRRGAAFGVRQAAVNRGARWLCGREQFCS